MANVTENGNFVDEHMDHLIKSYRKLEWCDDTKELQCVHSNQLIPWDCTECATSITQLDQQSEKIENKIYQLNVCCPNKMYGCTKVDTLKIIAHHLKDCKNTRENAPAAEIKEIPMSDVDKIISVIESARDSFHRELEAIKTEVTNNYQLIQSTNQNATDVKFRETIDYNSDIYHTHIIDNTMFKSGFYIIDKCLRVKIQMEPNSLSQSCASNDGQLLWKLEPFASLMQTERQQLIKSLESPYFYTSPEGYRVVVRAYINKDRLFAYLRFLTGKFDSKLTSKFPHTTTIAMLNKNAARNIVKSATHEDISVKDPQILLASTSDIERNGFIIDDCLMLKIEVKSTYT
ncbi:hypothetical protein CHUAL_011682 [Chamberlinius hualienensis]